MTDRELDCPIGSGTEFLGLKTISGCPFGEYVAGGWLVGGVFSLGVARSLRADFFVAVLAIFQNDSHARYWIFEDANRRFVQILVCRKSTAKVLFILLGAKCSAVSLITILSYPSDPHVLTSLPKHHINLTRNDHPNPTPVTRALRIGD